MLEHEKIDLIVSDIMMPEIDGIELCKLLKSNIEYSHIPIILLTAKKDEKDRADAYESGADAFISKPFNLNVLHARIKNLLKNRERIARDFKSQLVFDMKEMNFTNLDEDFLQRAIDCVNRHLDDSSFDQQQFSEEMNVSKSTLYNKLKTLTGLNSSAFITNIRMKAACRIMNQNRGIRISDLAYAVGFNDPKYFSSCFKKEFSMRPSEYIERFSGSVDS
jgi:response regulator RpfG family c-di-GMP phosphodiesterase